MHSYMACMSVSYHSYVSARMVDQTCCTVRRGSWGGRKRTKKNVQTRRTDTKYSETVTPVLYCHKECNYEYFAAFSTNWHNIIRRDCCMCICTVMPALLCPHCYARPVMPALLCPYTPCTLLRARTTVDIACTRRFALLRPRATSRLMRRMLCTVLTLHTGTNIQGSPSGCG